MVTSYSKLLFFIIVLNTTACSAQRFFQATVETDRIEANLEEKEIRLDFGHISYLENKSKGDEAIILLHGYSGEKDLWNQFATYLDESRRIIILDLPGHGKSIADINLGYSIKNQAKMLNAFFKAKKLKNIHLVGSSMGGAVAMTYTAMHADNVKTLVLVDALGVHDKESVMEQEYARTNVNPLLNICSRKQFDHFLYLSMEDMPLIPGFIRDYMATEKCKRAIIEEKIFEQIVKDKDLSHYAKKISTPTLIIWGKEDRVLHPDNGKLYHQVINGSELVMYEGIGHLPFMEAPGKTACEIEKFISKH